MPTKRVLTCRILQVFVPLVFVLPLAAQDSLQFNVPYLCNDGATYVVHRCATGPKGEFCYYQAEGESERYNTRQAVVYQMTKMCKVKGSSSASAPAMQPQSSDLQNSRWDCGSGATMTIFQCQKQSGQDYCFVKLEQNGQFLAQAPMPRNQITEKVKLCKPQSAYNPPYLSEFPNIDAVVRSMKVSDTHATVLRAMGAFYQLSEIIKALSGQRENGGLLPDEKTFLQHYDNAQAALIQLGQKQLPGQQFSLATNPYHFSSTDPKFGFEGIPVWVTFLSPTLQAQFAQMVGGNSPAYNAKIQQERQHAMQTLQADAQAAAEQAKPMRQDPGSVAMRHCMESGRSDMECLSEGLKVGLVDLAGGNPLKGIVPETAPGLRLSGVYAAGGIGIGFDQSTATVTCGDLIPIPLPYSVQRTASQLMITVPISPKPLLLSYKADGRLSGPGPIDVAGRVVVGGASATTSTGYQEHTETTTQQRQIDAAEAQNYAGTDSVHTNGMEYSVDTPVTTTTYEAAPVRQFSVPTKAKTERCNASLLPPTASSVKISDALTQLLGTQASKSANTAPGLRLAGTYAAPGGLKIEFRDDSATLQCGEAQAAEAYWVLPSGGQFAVKFQHSTPFTLALQPDGTLVGPGAVDVAGRRLVRSSNNDVHNFVSVNAHCTVGTLAAVKEQ